MADRERLFQGQDLRQHLAEEHREELLQQYLIRRVMSVLVERNIQITPRLAARTLVNMALEDAERSASLNDDILSADAVDPDQVLINQQLTDVVARHFAPNGSVMMKTFAIGLHQEIAARARRLAQDFKAPLEFRSQYFAQVHAAEEEAYEKREREAPGEARRQQQALEQVKRRQEEARRNKQALGQQATSEDQRAASSHVALEGPIDTDQSRRTVSLPLRCASKPM